MGAILLALVLGTIAVATPAQAAPDDRAARLHLVTFDGPGTAGYTGRLGESTYRERLLHRQDAALDAVAAPAPTYRWTTALNGVAVRLTTEQASRLRQDPRIALVERDSVRPLASMRLPAAGLRSAGGSASRGGAGVVVGVVDTGVWPESPLFADSPGLGRVPDGFTGACQLGEDWPSETCSDKLRASGWFVDGFGRDRIASAESLSARDVLGHGTQVASIAVGNAGVSIGERGLPADYSGVAPQARLAVYKACWSAPDPADDGCAAADLVTAVDRATADGIDVLNLSVTGAPDESALDHALLGAAEAGVVVVAAAGNDGRRVPAAPAYPWVTTVGGLTGTGHAGAVRLPGGPRLVGAMTVRRSVRAPLVLGRSAPAPGATAGQAASCAPGSLDASRTAGAVVVCERGGLGRLEKSLAVQRADGVGMVLVNSGPGGVAFDLHDVPTVHLARTPGRTLLRWVRSHRDAVVTLAPADGPIGPVRVPGWSAGGDRAGRVVKPDLVAPATGVLAAGPPSTVAGRWGFLHGTSAAAARTSGVAAVLLARQGWSASAVRSALATSAAPVPGGALRAGTGRLRPDLAERTWLVHETDPRDYRRWLRGTGDVNSPSVVLRRGDTRATRTVTNRDDRSRYWSVRATGFGRHDVRVTPAAVRLAPGESATYTVAVVGRVVGPDDGMVVWRGTDGVRTRVPVVIGR